VSSRVCVPQDTEGIVRGVVPLTVPSRYTDAPDGVELTDTDVVVTTGVGVKVYAKVFSIAETVTVLLLSRYPGFVSSRACVP
jgi:hypothetical protein